MDPIFFSQAYSLKCQLKLDSFPCLINAFFFEGLHQLGVK